MFQSIVLRRADGGHPISIGQIAEALLYYQKVHLFIDRGTLFSLMKQIGDGGILNLLKRPELSAVYCEEWLGTKTDTIGVTQYHNLIAFELAGHEGVGKLKTPLERLQYELERAGFSNTRVNAFGTRFLTLVPIHKFSGSHFLEGGIPHAAKQDLLDTDYLKQAISMAIRLVPGGYELGSNLQLEVIDSPFGFVVFTNVDFESINRRRAQAAPALHPLTIAHLLSNILDARADLALASFYGGDFVTSMLISSIIQIRHGELLHRTNLNLDAKESFREIVLPNCPSLAEVIDSGERSLDEFLNLLDSAKKFKAWLHTLNPDENLIRTYMRDVTSESWIRRLPAKTLRYMITTGIGAMNPVAGLLSGIVDNFLIEKLFSGWRPNHFVSKQLVPFVDGNS